MRRVIAVIVVAATLFGVGAPAGAATLSQIAEQLRCVTCGTSLDVSDAPAAQQMKQRIARELAAGRSEDQIIDGFVRDYGRQVLATPPKSGFDLWAGWVVPVVLPLVGLVVVTLLLRSWMRARRTVATMNADDATELDDADRARVDRELEAMGDG